MPPAVCVFLCLGRVRSGPAQPGAWRVCAGPIGPRPVRPRARPVPAGPAPGASGLEASPSGLPVPTRPSSLSPSSLAQCGQRPARPGARPALGSSGPWRVRSVAGPARPVGPRAVRFRRVHPRRGRTRPSAGLGPFGVGSARLAGPSGWRDRPLAVRPRPIRPSARPASARSASAQPGIDPLRGPSLVPRCQGCVAPLPRPRRRRTARPAEPSRPRPTPPPSRSPRRPRSPAGSAGTRAR